jgi:hypothetical protein
VAGRAVASGVRGGGTKTGGAARRGSHGARLPPAGWRLRQELRGLGCQQHPLHVPADAAGDRFVLTFDCQMPTLKVRFFTPSPSVLSSHISFDLDLFMECKIDQNFHMMQDICKISPVPSDHGQYRVEVSPKKLRHAKVCDFSAELCIKLYICRLNVTMYDSALTSFVKIS